MTTQTLWTAIKTRLVPVFIPLGYDRDGSCFEMNKISKESAKDSITGYGEYSC